MNKLFALGFMLIVGCSVSKNEVSDASIADSVSDTATSTDNVSYQPTDHSSPSQVGWGAFCCDIWGYRHCELDAWYPLGTACWCYGQGDGWVCR